MHSHLIPGIDDGSRTNEESFQMIDAFIEMGYEKIVTTPHIMTDYYGNTEQGISTACEKFKLAFREAGYTIPFQCAAEYYFDEKFFHNITSNKHSFLTFGDRHLLFETNAVSEPMQMKDMIFSATTQGYKLILAHPERYQYMTIEKAEDLRDRGVLLQVNLLSLIGYYGPPIQKMAEKLVKKGWVDLLGTDCHNMDHIITLKKVQQTKLYRLAIELPLLNYSL
jgi:protein-tyrosine phosphatase